MFQEPTDPGHGAFEAMANNLRANGHHDFVIAQKMRMPNDNFYTSVRYGSQKED